MRKWMLIGGILVILGTGATFVLRHGFEWPGSPWSRGTVVETLDGVPVYDNGPIASLSHGHSYAPDGTYFGLKWQPTEFVARYLYRARGHVMPVGSGSPLSFFDDQTPQGAVNEQRGLVQFRQGGTERPRKGDIIVLGNEGDDGQVGIVSDVGGDFVEIVWQDATPPRLRLPMSTDGGYRVTSPLPVLGWLRVPSMRAEARLRRIL
ncbi:hypothetical protein [Labrys monachus]|uniref:CHAP domain-containing protein n=1 Tax=Labrys monachus TaxID=217067 RepID=A0ABU0FKC7_9HYPH|nr:hypothetical protein [Labrys monachus]MDQ0394533.1 hypothetical protein [Labrys monachus]